MRLGILGVGRIGRFHARVLRAHPAVAALVIRDIDAARAADVAGELDAAIAPSTEALLADVDGVLIATPTSTHAALLQTVIESGRPVFCEKPVTLDLPSTRRLAAEAAACQAVVQVGFQRRFDAGYRAARELVHSGALGRVYTLRIAGHDPAPPAEQYVATSGGLFRDLLIHDFDIVRWVLGQEVEAVYMQGAVQVDAMFARQDDVDTAVGTLRLQDDTLGVLTGGRHDPLGYDIRLELLGSADSVAVGWDARTPLRSVEPGMPPAPPDAYPSFLERFAPAYRAELHHFVEVVAGRAESPCTIQDAEAALLVALACERSRRTGRPVTIAEVSADA